MPQEYVERLPFGYAVELDRQRIVRDGLAVDDGRAAAPLPFLQDLTQSRAAGHEPHAPIPEIESDRLLRYLFQQAHIPEYQVRFRWQPGDVAFWDNRATQHYAVNDYGPHRRVAERVAIAGDRPF